MDRTLDASRTAYSVMELAAQQVERCLARDGSAPTLPELMGVQAQGGATASGSSEHDYPALGGLTAANLAQVRTLCKVPMPTAIMEHFSHMQCHIMMGLFPDVDRAWLTIDSDIYLWRYEKGDDVAYYDGLGETIIGVGLVAPKPGVFHSYVRHLLVLTTSVDVVVLAVTFAGSEESPTAEIQLVPSPVFTIPTDGSVITTVAGTTSGRLFLGSKEGNLFEISYQAESSWFGKRFKKINHSTSALSFLVPSFLNAALGETNGIVQIEIDDSRNILYTLSEMGTIDVYDMGVSGTSFGRVARINQSQLVQMAMKTVKTLESQHFRPIVNISAVELAESAQINLVAVSHSGVRFYLTTVGVAAAAAARPAPPRPYCLALLHVRLPPGYSAAKVPSPQNVHMAHYRGRNLVLLCSVTENDTLWCVSSDLFPFASGLAEVHTTVSLDGPALSMVEVPYRKPSSKYRQLPEPPAVATQHVEPPRKYVVLTAHGAHVLLKPRPVDVLRRLLLDGRGSDSEPVRGFFAVQRPDEACATALALACLEDPQNADVAELAARAFLVFGGEPRVAGAAAAHQQTAISGLTFSPNVMSTPAPFRNPNNPYNTTHHHQTITPGLTASPNPMAPNPMSPNPMAPNITQFDLSPFQYSSKHNGLYIYLGRILRAIWNVPCVEKNVAQDTKKVHLTSTVTATDCVITLSHLNSLRNFILKNTQLTATTATSAYQNVRPLSTVEQIQSPNQSYTIHDAQANEKVSLDAFKTFLTHCCQVVGLWKILCEHQFHVLADCLSENQKQSLLNMAFKDLLLVGKDLCSIFINILINSYLGDNASVDSISSKLRDMCPDLYKVEDATISKANEILKSARNIQNLNEKEDLILAALELCKSVAPDINLTDVCHQFVGLKAYGAVMELCVLCAKKSDPKNIAVHFYTNSEQGDQQGYQCYMRRMEIYQHVVDALNSIFIPRDSITQSLANTSGLQSVNIDEVEDSHPLIRYVIEQALQYPDELLHVAVYEWMIGKSLTGDLINVKNKSLETYLQKVAKESPSNVAVMDLLWKYYETNGNHTAAAKILNNLASKAGNELNLQDRLSYLVRAVMCMRSDKVGYAPNLGVFLRELEDKIDIAKVQEHILEALELLKATVPGAEEATVALNSGLYEMTQLYENFADPFNLWESKLAIIECAGYSDAKLVEQIWRNIIDEELKKSSGTGNDKMLRILSKVKILARQYKLSSTCFPLQYILQHLEKIGAQLHADEALVADLFLSIEIPIDVLISMYSHLITSSSADRFWASEENEFHFFKVMAVLMHAFLATHENYSNVEKRKLITMCHDATASILSNLYCKPNAKQLIDTLRGIQAQLSRL